MINPEVKNIDCMEAMKGFPDKFFDLAIVDPPYGMHRRMDGPDGAGRIMRKFKRDTPSWDIKPSKEYFDELFRVSNNQIIWGGNNFIEWLYNTTGFIFWYKHQPAPNFADGELAWTSFQIPAKCFDHPCFGAHGQDPNGKDHPTQKPVKLYKWLLKNYGICKHCYNQGSYLEDVAGDGGSRMLQTCEECECYDHKPRILDTHLGSGSSRIAAHDMGFDFWGYEIDKDYFEAQEKRFKNHIAQLTLSL